MNKYVTDGIVSDAYNDHEIVRQVRYLLSETSAYCVKTDHNGGMAYNGELLTKVNNAITNILTTIIQPVEDHIDDGINHHEHDTRATQRNANQDGAISTPIG